MKHSFVWKQKIGDHHVEHQHFSWGNSELIRDFILEQDPDILVLQEITTQDIAVQLKNMLGFEYLYLVPSFQHAHNKVVFSKKELDLEKIEYEPGHVYDFLVCGDITLVPIHLHAFSAQIRSKQCAFLAKTFSDKTILLGDFNFWQWKKRFLFYYDKRAYQRLTHTFDDVSFDCVSTTVGLKMDKVFVSQELRSSARVKGYNVRGTFMDHYPLVLEIDGQIRGNFLS